MDQSEFIQFLLDQREFIDKQSEFINKQRTFIDKLIESTQLTQQTELTQLIEHNTIEHVEPTYTPAIEHNEPTPIVIPPLPPTYRRPTERLPLRIPKQRPKQIQPHTTLHIPTKPRGPRNPSLIPSRTPINIETIDNASGSAFYHFGNLLNNLDSFFETIKYMRQVDPDNYALYRRIGAQIVPDTLRWEMFTLPPEWRDGPRMMSGMVFSSDYEEEWEKEADKDNLIPTSFMSFQKLKNQLYQHPSIVLTEKQTIYAVAIYWYDVIKKQMSATEFHVLVDADCNVTLLRNRRIETVDLPRKKHGKHRSKQNFNKVVWDYGDLPDYLKANQERMPNDHAIQSATVEDFARYIFSYVVGFCYQANDGFEIRVRKNNVVARFNIAMVRTPYFFKDREKTITVNGATKRIFHIVRAHKRTMAGGAEKYIKSHFRGERRFSWKGYHVSISMPGWHHERIEEFDVAAVPTATKQRPDGYMDSAQLGDFMARQFEREH